MSWLCIELLPLALIGWVCTIVMGEWCGSFMVFRISLLFFLPWWVADGQQCDETLESPMYCENPILIEEATFPGSILQMNRQSCAEICRHTIGCGFFAMNALTCSTYSSCKEAADSKTVAGYNSDIDRVVWDCIPIDLLHANMVITGRRVEIIIPLYNIRSFKLSYA